MTSSTSGGTSTPVSHTEASACGAAMTRLRRAARAEILRCLHGSDDHAVIFAGSGATAGINRLVHLLGVGPGTTVILGPYEHHSNILPWRESGARVIELPEADCGGPCPDALALALALASALASLAEQAATPSASTHTATSPATPLRRPKRAPGRASGRGLGPDSTTRPGHPGLTARASCSACPSALSRFRPV